MHSTINPRLQLAFDNTSLSVFKDCPRKYSYSILKGWRSRAPASALLFGLAYHEVIEEYDRLLCQNVSVLDSLRQCIRLAWKLSAPGFGDDTRRTRLTLIRSLVYYSEQFANDPLKTFVFPNGKIALEMSFRFQLPFSAKTGEPFMYAGHMDKLGMYNGSLYTVERKTTTTTLGDSFYDRYTFSSQIGGYVYAGKVVYDTPVSGAIIEACQVAVNFSRFGRVVVHRVNSHLEEWMSDVHYWIGRVEECAESDFWPHNTEACSKFGGCQFRSVCNKSPEVRELILKSDFKVEFWNPLISRGE